MAKRKRRPEMKTPEEVIAARRRLLANRQEVTSFFGRLILLALLFWILFGVVFGIKPMSNGDMSPRISAGDLMLFYRLDKGLSNSEVVVFKKAINGIQGASRPDKFRKITEVPNKVNVSS
ncbi:hypothetical protein [Frisingicoccus sp.]|uniref:hypothetical protein n=1 Tax=Frisingicoccus sp. TaxID=1918627 RepID=UPI00399B0D9C